MQKMANHIFFIKDITTLRMQYKLKVRVVRLWEVLDCYNSDNNFFIELVLQDEKRNCHLGVVSPLDDTTVNYPQQAMEQLLLSPQSTSTFHSQQSSWTAWHRKERVCRPD
ncbi:PREDICTED: uncharacterized protein LOC109214218 [Nicotiana attenuata]|uniref:uncharacterized protein LOC109214218 n=1 Tax=Nicotiana attenuata TaxID=49451 RepID=UPI000905A002|nr:PREDICTED: uncharacterized protein LOC109214218 [Nicotiana attenuata]